MLDIIKSMFEHVRVKYNNTLSDDFSWVFLSDKGNHSLNSYSECT